MWCWLVAILDELIQAVVTELTTVCSPLMCAEHGCFYTHVVQLTIRSSSACLTLQPQRRPKPGPIVEAPALLHLGRAPAHQLGPAHHLIARGTALAVVDGCLPALHALTTRTRHPNPLLKTQLLTAERNGRKERGRE